MIDISAAIECEAFMRMILVDTYPGEMPLRTARWSAGVWV